MFKNEADARVSLKSSVPSKNILIYHYTKYNGTTEV
jgi:hypothetical protein